MPRKHTSLPSVKDLSPAFNLPFLISNFSPPIMSFTSKPTFVLLHGAWHSPSCWSKATALLSTHGYASITPALPSTGASPPLPDFTADVETIRSAITELVEEGKDVIVVTHSYSGIPGGQALEGLDKKTVAEKGDKGGVVRMVYIMSFIVPEGFQHSPHGTRDNMVPAMKTDFEVYPHSPFPHHISASSQTQTYLDSNFILGWHSDCRISRRQRPLLPRSPRPRRRLVSQRAASPKPRCLLEHDFFCSLEAYPHNLCDLRRRHTVYGRGCRVSPFQRTGDGGKQS